MVRVTNAVATRRRKRRLMKRAKGFVGDRKNHLRLTQNAVQSAMAFNYKHRKQRKSEFRQLWIVRLNVAARINGIPYNKLVDGLKKAGCLLNRKVLSELAIADPAAFTAVVSQAKAALA